jgi:hypothetical protein
MLVGSLVLAVAVVSTAVGLWAAQDSRPGPRVAPIQIRNGPGEAADRAGRPQRETPARKSRSRRVQGAQPVSPPDPAPAGLDDPPEPVEDGPAPAEDAPGPAGDAGGDAGRVEEGDEDGAVDETDGGDSGSRDDDGSDD